MRATRDGGTDAAVNKERVAGDATRSDCADAAICSRAEVNDAGMTITTKPRNVGPNETKLTGPPLPMVAK